MTDLEKLCSRVTEAADCAVITDDVNRRYFTAMKSSAGTLVVFPEKAYFIIDFRYIEKAKKTVTACEVILQDKLYEQINSLIESMVQKQFLLMPIPAHFPSLSHISKSLMLRSSQTQSLRK